MRGVNKVILIGNLGRDPEVRYTPSGDAVCSLAVATSETWKDKQTGEAREQTEWHKVVFYGRLAEVAGEFLCKGSKVYIEGSIHTRKYQDKQTGQDKYATEIKGRELQMLDARQEGGQTNQQHAAPQQRQQAPQQQRRQAPAQQPDRSMEYDESDIPF